MVAHWGAFANRLLRNYTRKYMFKFWKIEKPIIMRENMARRTLIRASLQYGPFRPTDIHECSRDYRARDVVNAPGSSRQEFQAYLNPRNLGPGDLEELSPELWEEFRLHGAADEYDLHMQDLADEEAQGTEPDLDRPPGLSEATVADIPRTTLSGLKAQNPELHRDSIIELQAMRDRDRRDPESPLISEPEADDQPGSHGPGAASGASSMPRTVPGRRWQSRPPSSGPHNVALAGCDVSYQSDLVRVDTLPVVDMWSPEEDSTCHSKAWGELAEDRLRYFGLTFCWIDGSTKSFAGLGSSTKTLGKRNLPVCIQVGEDSLGEP